ncbi:MAG: hypothetical protein HZT43_21510 [Exiguobacterium profundum]|nr:MAG: hypothetical protein HZT43_21510 [Exiguobacterium profundum]
MALFAGLILLLGCVAWVSSDRAQANLDLKAAFAAPAADLPHFRSTLGRS